MQVVADVLRRPALMLPHLQLSDLRWLDMKLLRHVIPHGLCVDKDNTLVPHKSQLGIHPPISGAVAEAVRLWGRERVLVVSNSAGCKDDQFAHPVDRCPSGGSTEWPEALAQAGTLPILQHRGARKPFCTKEVSGYFRDLEPQQQKDIAGAGDSELQLRLATVGDRLLTDVVFGNINGWLAIHTYPLDAARDSRSIKLARFLEETFFNLRFGGKALFHHLECDRLGSAKVLLSHRSLLLPVLRGCAECPKCLRRAASSTVSSVPSIYSSSTKSSNSTQLPFRNPSGLSAASTQLRASLGRYSRLGGLQIRNGGLASRNRRHFSSQSAGAGYSFSKFDGGDFQKAEQNLFAPPPRKPLDRDRGRDRGGKRTDFGSRRGSSDSGRVERRPSPVGSGGRQGRFDRNEDQNRGERRSDGLGNRRDDQGSRLENGDGGRREDHRGCNGRGHERRSDRPDRGDRRNNRGDRREGGFSRGEEPRRHRYRGPADQYDVYHQSPLSGGYREDRRRVQRPEDLLKPDPVRPGEVVSVARLSKVEAFNAGGVVFRLVLDLDGEVLGQQVTISHDQLDSMPLYLGDFVPLYETRSLKAVRKGKGVQGEVKEHKVWSITPQLQRHDHHRWRILRTLGREGSLPMRVDKNEAVWIANMRGRKYTEACKQLKTMGLVEVDEVAEVVTLTEQGRLTLRALTGAQLVISGAHETADEETGAAVKKLMTQTGQTAGVLLGERLQTLEFMIRAAERQMASQAEEEKRLQEEISRLQTQMKGKSWVGKLREQLHTAQSDLERAVRKQKEAAAQRVELMEEHGKVLEKRARLLNEVVQRVVSPDVGNEQGLEGPQAPEVASAV